MEDMGNRELNDVILTFQDMGNMEFAEPKFKYWRYDDKYLTCHCEQRHHYDIPISELNTPIGVCKWLGQINEKSWASHELLGEMVAIINHIVGDLRGLR